MNKLLLVGFVCLSLGAFAQTSAGQGQTSNGNTDAAKDTASGAVSGKRMHKPLAVQQNGATGDSTAGTIHGGKSATDDWTARSAAKSSGSSNGSNNGSNNGQASAHVATGDVNGDGKADLTPAKNSGHATEKNAVLNSSSSVQSPRDAATGQASGKRQHDPVVVRKKRTRHHRNNG